jgi:tetratricopeptide (TPR) repeat protein
VGVDRGAEEQARAYNRHAIGLAQDGKLEEAEAWFRQAVEYWPDYAEAHNNLGNVLSFQNKLSDAVACYEQAMRIWPTQADFYSNLAHVLWKQGKLEEAIALCHQALRLQPDFAEAYNHLGLALQSQEKWDEAEACYRESLRLRPDLADACYNMSHILWRRQRLDEAEAYCHEAIRLRPGFSDAYNNLGLVFQSRGRWKEAEECFRESLRLRPDSVEANNNLGMVLVLRGKLEEGEASCRRALQLRPGNCDAYINLAVSFCRQRRLEEAVVCCDEVERIDPNSPHAASVRGIVCLKQANLPAAAEHFERAIRLKPDYADAHMNLGFTLLLDGNFERGWREYQWRWKSTFGTDRMPTSLWDGSPLAGRSIALYAEQGLGDTLQFIRYAPMVKRQGCNLTVVCQRPLLSLLSRSPGIDRLAAQDETMPQADFYSPLLNLPHLIGTSLATIPADVPYLLADPVLIERWRDQMGVRSGLKVGIAWRGNPDHPEDRHRSVRLAAFAPLARVGDVDLISLQVGPGVEQLTEKEVDFRITDVGSKLQSFDDTAAVVRNLDLIITVDTALAHLAGGLGVPVWVLVPFAPDWRWLLGREDTPWYPTMRLFRQARWGDWDHVLARIAAELAKLKGRNPQSAIASA